MATAHNLDVLSKDEEISRLDNFLADCPNNSYLRSIIGNIRPAVVQAIRCDFSYIDYNPHTLEKQSRELAATILKQQAEARELGRQLADYRRQLARLSGDLETLGGDAATIGRIAAERAAAIKRALA